MRSENGNYKSFAEDVEKNYGGIYFEKGAFEKLTDVALRATFSKETPTAEEVEECLKTVESISDKLYSKSNRVNKLKLMYISVLK